MQRIPDLSLTGEEEEEEVKKLQIKTDFLWIDLNHKLCEDLIFHKYQQFSKISLESRN